jgi:hypothetical protein
VEGYFVLKARPGLKIPLDGSEVSVEDETLVLIHPNCQHRSVGDELVIFVLPMHGDPRADMLFDEPARPADDKKRYQVVDSHSLEFEGVTCDGGVIPFRAKSYNLSDTTNLVEEGQVVMWYVLKRRSQSAKIILGATGDGEGQETRVFPAQRGLVVGMKPGCLHRVAGSIRVLSFLLNTSQKQ